MTEAELFHRLTKIFVDVLDNEEIVLDRTTTAADIEEWDSLNHISLIVAIERDFNIQLVLEEIEGLRNVGDMIDLISRKIT